MLDHSDEDFAIWAFLFSKGGIVFTIIGLIVVIAVSVVVSQNEEECLKQKCARGAPVLMNHECLCVEKPLDGGTP